eukprot:362231-Chlamydomonas_euryale.AAC.5
MHARWAMLGVAGILAQEVANPDQFWYTSGLPENLPEPFNRPEALGGLLAFEFCLMHWVEVRRWMDYKNPGSVNQVRIIRGSLRATDGEWRGKAHAWTAHACTVAQCWSVLTLAGPGVHQQQAVQPRDGEHA